MWIYQTQGLIITCVLIRYDPGILQNMLQWDTEKHELLHLQNRQV